MIFTNLNLRLNRDIANEIIHNISNKRRKKAETSFTGIINLSDGVVKEKLTAEGFERQLICCLLSASGFDSKFHQSSLETDKK